MVGPQWPFPGDSPLVRARKVANAYRAALAETQPIECESLDAMMREWAQDWAVPRVVRHSPSDWLDVRDAADLASCDPAMLRTWRARGRLTGRKVHGRWQYQTRDILALSAGIRKRREKASHGAS